MFLVDIIKKTPGTMWSLPMKLTHQTHNKGTTRKHTKKTTTPYKLGPHQLEV